jgi:hypothetical protein
MMRPKKGMELQVNFIVMLVLAIAMFSLGLTVLYMVFSGAQEYEDRISEQMERQMEDLMYTGGKKVVIPSNQVTLEKGDAHTFWIGIRNHLDDVTAFRAVIDCVGALKPNEDVICDSESEPCTNWCGTEGHWFMEKESEYEVEQNNHIIRSIVIRIPKRTYDEMDDIPRGIYILNILVQYKDPDTSEWHDYDTIKKLRITVK